MKRIIYLFIAVLIASLTFVSCKKDDGEKGINIQASEAKPEFDASNYGVYRGVFAVGNGCIVINLNNSGTTPVAHVEVNGKKYTLTTTDAPAEGVGTTITFSKESDIVVFSVNANGTNPKITSATIAGKSEQVIVAKETSTTVVECYLGTFSGGGVAGTFNMVITGDKLNVSYSFTGDTYPESYGSGNLSGNSISGSFSDGVTFTGTRNNGKLSGSWNNPGYAKGSWKSTYKFTSSL